MTRLVSTVLAVLACGASLGAQQIQNPTVLQANRAYDIPDFRQVIGLARTALSERLSAAERARAYELLGFSFSATSQPDSAIAAFSEMIALAPDYDFDPKAVSPRVLGYFNAALGRVLVIRHLSVDSARFVSGAAGSGVPIRFTVTSPARVTARAEGSSGSVLIDSGIVVGTLTLKWGATLASGDPVPAADWTIVVTAAGPGQSTYSVSQRVRLTVGTVDTQPHLVSLPGYSELSETEPTPRSDRPLVNTMLYVGAIGAVALAFSDKSLGPAPRRELSIAGAAALLAGLAGSLKRPPPHPVFANIQFNKLLRDQLARRNADIAAQNVVLRRQVQIDVVPIAPVGGP